MALTVCRLLHWKQSITLSVVDEPRRHDSFDKFREKTQVGDRPVGIDVFAIQRRFLEPWLNDGVLLTGRKTACIRYDTKHSM